jgi:trans-aconitate methyltransferase
LVSYLDFLLKLTEELVVDYASELERKLEEAFPRSVDGRPYV